MPQRHAAFHLRLSRLASALLPALAAASQGHAAPLPPVATTADAATAQAGTPATVNLDQIQVTGFRAAATAAVDAKRESQVVLDAVSDDDIGSLPDLSIVESARRIVGLSTVAGMDPTRNRDLYERVTIRGLDPKYNLITIDGVPMASSEIDVRGARLDQLPSPMVSRIEAIKTLTPQYDPHGLGGQVNLVTRSAFDKPDGFVVVNAGLGHSSSAGAFVQDDRPLQKANATASKVFGERGQWGVVVSLDWQKLWSTSHSQLPGDSAGAGWVYYTPSGTATPFANLSRDGVLYPVRPQGYWFDDARSRKGINAKLEYLFANGGEISLFGGHYQAVDAELRAEQLAIPSTPPRYVDAQHGSYGAAQFQQGIVWQPQTRDTDIVTLKGAFRPTDDVSWDATASWSRATSALQRDMYKWASDVRPGSTTTLNATDYRFDYALDGGKVLATFPDPRRATDPSSYDLLYLRNITRDSASTVRYVAANVALNADPEDQGFGARAGASYTDSKVGNDQSYQEWFARNAAAQTAIGGLPGYTYPTTWPSDFIGGVPFYVVDPAKGTALIANHPEWLAQSNRVADNYTSDFDDKEAVTGVYAEGVFRSERFYALAGVRYDDTKVDVTTWQVPNPAAPSAYAPALRKGGYAYLLPSALATWKIDDDARLTAAVSKTIGRPDYAQYAATTAFAVTSSGGLAISRGNPALEPRQSVNLDLSYEWFMDDGGLFSAAVFQKRIRNEIFTAVRSPGPTAYNGVVYDDVSESTPLNSGRGKVRGLELNYVSGELAFLPDALRGLGVSSNLTLLDGSFDIPASSAAVAAGAPASRRSSGLVQQPDYIANATVFYRRGGFEARASWNRIGEALQLVSSDTPERDLYAQPRSQLDLQLSYAINPAWDVMLQAQNITRAPFVVRQGPGQALVNNYFPVGSTLWLSFSWHPNGGSK
ncbi:MULTISPECIES: TonB-dependent receptor [unclassified Xanthomonas]|uniref:TonB-dependent receptor n=1 Tax=Xanthomonas sp. LMG 9002 TaxID=1591158 RepID=UPI00136CA71F|nr:TonB-dependent receptor [Xanthomonas sp. LMG 9002]MXV07493.1 TonB-dependent receptor [Xanthomonas sp. LMG 9002]